MLSMRKDDDGVLIITPIMDGGGWNMFYRLLKYIYTTNSKNHSTISDRKLTIIGLGPKDVRLAELNHENHIHIITAQWFDYYFMHAHQLERVPVLNLMGNSPLLIFSLAYLFVRAKKLTAFISNGFLSAMPAVLYKVLFKKSRIRIYVWIHTDSQFNNKRLIRKLLYKSSRYIDTFFVNSLDVQNDIANCNIPAEKIQLIPNWIDKLEVSKDQLAIMNKKYVFLNNYEFAALYLGRFVEYKHFLTYLKVAKGLASDSIAFIFIGKGELSFEVENASKNNSHIYHFEDMTDIEVRHLLSKVNVTLTYADENYLGLSGYESLSAGTPVIYLDVSCAPDKYHLRTRIIRNIVPDGLGYRLPQDAVEISKFLSKLKQSKSPSQNQRERCRDYIDKFHSERNAQIILSCIFGQ